MIERISIPEERLGLLRKGFGGFSRQLEKFTCAKLGVGDAVSVECEDPFMLRRVVEVVKAFGRGFDFDDALDMLDEDYTLEVIDIRGFGRSKGRQEILRGRVIGKDGTVKRMIEKGCDAKIAVYGKTVSVMCRSTDMARTAEAVGMILSGSKFGSVARFLKQRPI